MLRVGYAAFKTAGHGPAAAPAHPDAFRERGLRGCQAAIFLYIPCPAAIGQPGRSCPLTYARSTSRPNQTLQTSSHKAQETKSTRAPSTSMKQHLRSLFLSCFDAGSPVPLHKAQAALQSCKTAKQEPAVDVSLHAHEHRDAAQKACSGLTMSQEGDAMLTGRTPSSDSSGRPGWATSMEQEQEPTVDTKRATAPTMPSPVLLPTLIAARARAHSMDQEQRPRRAHTRRSVNIGAYRIDAGEAGAAGAADAAAFYQQLVHAAARQANYTHCPFCSPTSPCGGLSPRHKALLNPQPFAEQGVTRREPRAAAAAATDGAHCHLTSTQYSSSLVAHSVRRASPVSGFENMSRLLQLTANGRPLMEALAERRSSRRGSQNPTFGMLVATQAQLALTLASAQAATLAQAHAQAKPETTHSGSSNLVVV